MLSQEHQICDYYYQLWRWDLALFLFFFVPVFFNESFILLEFEIALNVVFFPPSTESSAQVAQKNQLVRAWLIAACSHWLNCNRFLPNVRKRRGLVPFNVRQMRPEGKGLCYHSYVTECGEWQGGARSLIGVNTCGVERGAEPLRQCPVNASQEKHSTGFWREAVIFTYWDGFGQGFL